MTDPQVLLDTRGAREPELRASITTLLGQVPVVELVGAPTGRLAELAGRHDDRVRPAQEVRSGVPVLVGSGRLCWATGGVRRVLTDLSVPGRSLTRVVVHGLPMAEGQVACWAPEWVAGFSGTPEELTVAGLQFDRRHLPHDSPVVRSWLRADAVGVALVAELGESPERWSRRTGRVLARHELMSRVRAPLGALRRRARRSRHRHLLSAGPHRSS